MYERLKEFMAKLTGSDAQRRRAHALYVAIADASRREVFYRDLDVPDTPEGRYDVLSIHAILLMRRLRGGGASAVDFAQLVFDVMFRDIDDSLREMGVGDMRVGKKVRSYAEAFYGRAKAYEDGLDGEGDLTDAVARNVYGDDQAPYALALADYMRTADQGLAGQDTDDIMAARIELPEPSVQGVIGDDERTRSA
ncbi:MAG: ubiquinol-cytochrome C chaperone family protein [Pseudomonadota bacterium]